MEKRQFKNEIYTAIAQITKAFSTPNRLEIIDLLANGEKTVETIAAQTAISIANASQHLQVLKIARLVKTRREGHSIYYSLQSTHVYAAWKALRDLALEEEPYIQKTIRQFRQENGSSRVISFKALAQGGSYWLLDVRPTDEFRTGHITNAHGIPLADLPERMAELPHDKTIIAYCRGQFCTYADEAVQWLKVHGFSAMRLDEGYFDVVLQEQITGITATPLS